MKLVALCLFAVCCWSLANATDGLQVKKLKEVLRQVDEVKAVGLSNTLRLHAPPQNITDCCFVSALNCSRMNLQTQIDGISEKQRTKLYKSLTNRLTLEALDFCGSGDATTTCQPCTSRDETLPAFFKRLETFIQLAISKRSMG